MDLCLAGTAVQVSNAPAFRVSGPPRPFPDWATERDAHCADVHFASFILPSALIFSRFDPCSDAPGCLVRYCHRGEEQNARV